MVFVGVLELKQNDYLKGLIFFFVVFFLSNSVLVL